jgi:glycosyltransferase involved in cell wall biosynthesis
MASLTTVGGTTRAFLKGQFEALNCVGIRTTVICAEDPDLNKVLPKETEYIPVEFTRVFSPLKDLKALWILYRIFHKEKFDLVQYASPKAALLGSIAAFCTRVPIRLYLLWGLYYEGQTGITKNLYKFLEWFISLLSTHILPNSHEMANHIIQQKIVPQRKCEVLLNGSACGIDFEEYNIEKWRPQRGSVRQELGLSNDSVLIGVFGRLTGDKGINETVDAFRQIAQQVPNVYLLVIGNQEEKDNLLPATIEEIKKHSRIISLPYQQTLLPYYAAIDIICLPTYREGFPQTPLEAQAMEIPVVSTDISGVREAVINNKTGFLVKPRDSRALVEPILKLINDKDLRIQMGCEGRKRVLEMFNQKNIIQAVVQHRLKLCQSLASD